MPNYNPAAATALSTVAPQTAVLSTTLDPRLQRYIIRRRLGQTKVASSSTNTDEVAVVALVTDPGLWENLSEVRMGAVLGPDNTGATIVTGRIPVQRIEQVRAQPFVKSLKAPLIVRPSLAATTEETEARPLLLPPATKSGGGAGVVIGIVDFGCDFAHQNFRLPNGDSRLRCIWDQNGALNADSPFGYGKKYTRDEINRALQGVDPYTVLGYGPEPDQLGHDTGTHGTHVMDIAAGNGHGSNVPGVAPEADLIFVQLAATDVAWSGAQVIGDAQKGQSFGDSVQLLEALKFIFDEAGDQPCVINLSLGTNGGPHDGTTLVEQGIDTLIGQKPNRAVVIAASNSFADGIHASGVVPQAGSIDLAWNVANNDQTDNELEVWYSGQDQFTVELFAPDNTSALKVGPGTTDALQATDGKPIIIIANRLHDPNNLDNTINIFMAAGLPAGIWKVRLIGDQVVDGHFHAWIERDDISQSQFAAPTDDSHTIGAISCGQLSIVVGSYDAHKQGRPLSWFSSAGPTRDGRQKPEVSAPGQNVLAAWSRTKTKVTQKSGTSMAAPAVVGIIALALAEAKQRGMSISGAKLCNMVIAACRHEPPAGKQWDARYGHGRLSAKVLVQAVIDKATKDGGLAGEAMAKAKKPAKPRKHSSRKTNG